MLPHPCTAHKGRPKALGRAAQVCAAVAPMRQGLRG